MDISDEELFDVPPSCSTSITNRSLNSSKETNDLPDSKQKKYFSNVTSKDILVKVIRLPKANQEQTNSRSKTKKRRFWKFGQLRRKKTPSFVLSRFQQEFQKIEPATETISELSEDKNNEEMNTQMCNQSYKEGESHRDDQENEQSKSQRFFLSTYQAQEDSYDNEVYGCARTLSHEYHRKDSRISNNKTIKDTASSFLLSPNSKNTEPNLYSDRSYPSDCSSSSNTKKDKRSIHSRLTFMAKRIGKQLNEWKFKRKYFSSDSEDEELPLPRKRPRRISSTDSDIEDAPVNNVEAIENNNQSKSHLSFEKIDKKKTGVQINGTVRIILTRLEEMKNEDVIKWRESKTMPSDVITSESVEGQQLDQQRLLQNLITLESQNNSILPNENGFLETKEISKDPPSTSDCVEKHSTTKSRLNKLRKKYKLFKKPRVLMIKLDTLQYSPKDGKYSTTEIDRLTKTYVTFVINSTFHKSCGLKMYRHERLRRKSTLDVEDIAEDQNTSVSRRQSTNEIFNPCVTEESPIKDVQSDESAPFKIHRKFAPIQNQDKSSSSETFKKKNNHLSPKHSKLWRNAFHTLIKMHPKKSRKKTVSVQSMSTLKTLSTSQRLSKKSAKCDSVFTLPSTSTSSTNNMPVGSPRKLASLKKQTEISAKPTESNDTSKSESSVSSKNLPSDANVGKIISRSDFIQFKNSIVSKNQHKKPAKEENIIVLDTFLNSTKKISAISSKLHDIATDFELSTSDTSMESKSSEWRSVKQSPRKTEQTCICGLCDMCGATFKNYEMFLQHLAEWDSLNKTCAAVSPTSNNVSKSVEVSTLKQTAVNKKYGQNLENMKSSASQEQLSSVNGEDNSNQLDKSVVDSEMEILSSSSISSSPRVLRARCNYFKMPHKKIKTRSTTESKSDLKLNSPSGAKFLSFKNVKWNRSTNVKLKRPVSCQICFKVFDTYAQLLQHMFKHMANDLRSMYTSIENEIVSTHQESNDLVFDDTEENSMEAAVEEIEIVKDGEQEKRLSENTNESSAENVIVLDASQQDANKERNKASNLPAAEHTVERDSQKRSTPIAGNAVQKVQGTEKEKTSVAESSISKQLTKSFTICECHRPKASNKSSKTDIEIALMCTMCQTLFRRFECFEMHCTQRSAESTPCHRRHGRQTKLFCTKCQQILNSLQELFYHLKMHSRVDRPNKVSFCCNICKVIFHSFGPLFINHFQSHMKNPFFLANHLSFPRPFHIGSKISKLLTADKSMEVYMQVADFMCHDCRKPFVSLQALKSHKAVCSNITTTSVDPCSGSSDDRNSNTSNSRAPSILLMCGFCNKTFYSRTSFELHSLEHTQKRDVHLHYTCVDVTAVTKVYICKVCTTMWQSLQNFEEHWQTHSALQEEYVCSRCQNRYRNIDLFQKHTIVHKNTKEMQQLPLTCEVIYRDVSDSSSQTNSQKDATTDDLPYVDLSFFDFTEKVLNDKSQELRELTQQDPLQDPLEKLPFEDQSTQEVIILLESSISSNKELQQATSITTSNVSRVPVQVPSPNVAVAESKRSTNGSSKNLDNDSNEEEGLTIVLSESEESTVSSGIRKEADPLSTPSTKQQNTQESTKPTSDSAVTDEQMQCSNDTAPAASSAKTSNDVNGSANSNARINVRTPESLNTQLDTNASNLWDHNTSGRGTSTSTTTEARIDHANETPENCADRSVSPDANSSGKELKEPLPKNAMSSMPKSFLRVRSLAELTEAPPLENHFCRTCGVSFESRQKLEEHVSVCVSSIQLSRQDMQSRTSSSDNVQVWPTKPMFNPMILIPTSIQDSLSSVTAISNVSPSSSVCSNTSSQMIGTAKSQQVIGVKPLNFNKSNTVANVSKSKNPKTISHELTRPSDNVIATPQHNSQKTTYHQNLPPHINHSLKKSDQHVQQQQNGTVAVRPFVQIPYQSSRPSPPPYPQQPQQQQSLQVQQQPPQMQQPRQQRQQSYLRLLHQQLPQHVSQQIQRIQLQLQQQQQQPLQQQQVNSIVQFLISKTDMSYQLAPNNMTPPNSDNCMLVAVNTMQQISKNPDRYVCLYCPGFECNSVEEFTLHEHSSKHEARSHYNDIAHVP